MKLLAVRGRSYDETVTLYNESFEDLKQLFSYMLRDAKEKVPGFNMFEIRDLEDIKTPDDLVVALNDSALNLKLGTEYSIVK